MKATTKGRYALRAMVDLARTPENTRTTIRHIAEKQDISPLFLEQIFHRLEKKGLVNSMRGPNGGFKLKKKTNQISVKDILEAAGEELDLTPCNNADEGKPCPRSPQCIARYVWDGLREDVYGYLADLTLEKIIKDTNR